MGIDPGVGSTGYGVIGNKSQGTSFYCASGVIRSSPSLPLSQRLQQIFHGILHQIKKLSPQMIAIEAPFLAKNVKSAMVLGQARGAAILAAAEEGLEVHEFSPLEVKQAVVGYGRADKRQVQAMTRAILHAPDGLSSHAADALAVAICLAHSLPWKNSLHSLNQASSPLRKISWPPAGPVTVEDHP